MASNRVKIIMSLSLSIPSIEYALTVAKLIQIPTHIGNIAIGIYLHGIIVLT